MYQPQPRELTGAEIAVVGMAGRFPGAPGVDALWQNLVDGVEGIRRFTPDELRAAGIPDALIADPTFVPAGGWLEGADHFDAAFFRYTPREAELTDPQQRIFLECAWAALEDAGYAPGRVAVPAGVYAGVSQSIYWIENLLPNRELMAAGAGYEMMVGNDKDYVASRVAYKLGLRGPAVCVQTACSTSLVAVHLACRALLSGDCDLALAGGASVHHVRFIGHVYRDGAIFSPDGHCRAFDEQAAGTVGGSGAGVVVLKRLEDALADGDSIRAVLLGTAVNNDGAAKVGFMAPGAEGQAAAITDALNFADVDARSVGYVEAHGTGTPLGDPVEVAALTRAYRGWTADRGFCALGSIKASIGHLDHAAGVAGLIKTVLALQNRTIPRSLYFTRANPKLEIERTPFYVAAETRAWDADGPRRAGVSSFGIGGTNAHAVLEEAPAPAPRDGTPRPVQLLALSARTESALDAARRNLADHLERHPSTDLADAAFTLQQGRAEMEWRAAVPAADAADAIRALRSAAGTASGKDRPVAFLFPGQGAQHVRMAAGVYAHEPVFRDALDRCAEILLPELDLDLRDLLYPAEGEEDAATERLGQTAVTQPAIFAVGYALAQLWMSWGVRPDAMLGHSVGEFVAACLAGVFSLDDALRLVAARGRLMQSLPAGAMLAVFLPEAGLLPRLPGGVALAAVNGPATCVVSGPTDSVRAFQAALEAEEVEVRRLHTSHAFHSSMMDPVLAPFRELVRRASPRAPSLPYVSSLTGTWITAAEAVDPDYYARQLRHAVRFADGVETLLAAENRVLIEVGPGRTLGTLIPRGGSHVAIPSLPHAKDAADDVRALLDAVGQAWAAGVPIDWTAFNAGRGGRRVPLPTYPFERQRYYLERPVRAAAAPVETGKRADAASWFYLPSWRRAELLTASADDLRGQHWLVFADARGVGAAVLDRLRDRGARVTTVRVGGETAEGAPGRWMLDPRADDAYDALVSSLVRRGEAPAGIVHGWTIGDSDDAVARGAAGIVALARALARHGVTQDIRLVAVTEGAQEVDGRDAVDPARAAILGPLRVIPQEYPNLSVRAVDLDPSAHPSRAADAVLAEIGAADSAAAVAIRGGRRWVQAWEPVRIESPASAPAALREHGVWMITGGLGGIGRGLAEWLAAEARARIVLVARTPLPPREEWDSAAPRSADGERIAAVRAIEAAGGEVIVAAADVADEDAMRRVIADVRARWGRIDGVIHAAAAPLGAVLSISDTGARELAAHLRPKLGGIRVLDAELADDPPAVAIAFSSLSGILGGLRFAAYAAGNAALDAFAHGGALPWVSVDWDGWHTGEGESSGFSMTMEEGIEALRRILALPRVPRIAVSTGDLQARLDRWVSADPASASPDTAANSEDAGHARPALRTAFVEPRGELEEAVAGVWRELLGVGRIGAEDDFFELGGHSLLGTRVIARLRRMFGVEVPVDAIFRAPTVALLAQVVEDRLLAAVEAMSDDEALALGADAGTLQVTGD